MEFTFLNDFAELEFLSSPIINGVILILLTVVLIMLAVALTKLSGGAKPQVQTVSPTASQLKTGLNPQVVAAIAGAIAAYGQQEGKSYRVVDIRPSISGQDKRPIRSSWGNAGIIQNNQSFR